MLGSTPSTVTEPPSRFRYPSRISTVVVLPAPFGPSRPKTSPCSTVKRDPRDGLDCAVALAEIAAPRVRSRGELQLDHPGDREPGIPPDQCKGDLGAIGLVADGRDGPRSPSTARISASAVAPGASVSSMRTGAPVARPISAAVCRARSRGLESTSRRCIVPVGEPVPQRTGLLETLGGKLTKLVWITGAGRGMSAEVDAHRCARIGVTRSSPGS